MKLPVKILTVGAYERDNFGDALFYIITKKYLEERGYQIFPASLLYSGESNLLEQEVLPIDFMLKSQSWDAVWVVGGEVGGVDIDTALTMSLADEQHQLYFNEHTSIDQKRILLKLLDINSDMPAYVPDLSQYEKNINTTLVLNSVGLSGPGGIKNETAKKQIDTIVKRKNTITSVRDKKSSNILNKLGVDHILAPDLVHLLPEVFPNLKDTETDKYICFQINEFLLRQYNVEEISQTLVSLTKMLKARIVLFSAGTARHHDSPVLYELLRDSMNKSLGENLRPHVLLERDPIKLAKTVANSILWIGTSLHGRIISKSYDVPRISLSNPKVKEYALKWDDTYPSDIPPDDILNLIDKVMTTKVAAQEKHKVVSLVDKSLMSLLGVLSKTIREES